MEGILVFSLLLSLLSASDGSHSLRLLSTYINGETQFPKFSCTVNLDDITVAYYKDTYIPRGNTTNEDDVIDPNNITIITVDMHSSFERRLRLFGQNNILDVYQTLVVCELLGLDKPGKMIICDAVRGSTTDELSYFNNTFTYFVTANITQNEIKPHLVHFENVIAKSFYPICISTLKNYLKKRESQVNRKISPNIRLIQKASSDSGGFRVTCLATGFYPRHLNLSLFRDGQPVSDHEVTGGDLLPNGDGTYQMRKSLEIRGDERHKYSCSVTHLGKKWDTDLDSDNLTLHIGVAVAVVLACAVCVILATVIWKRDKSKQRK